MRKEQEIHWPAIWCDNCLEVVPLATDFMAANRLNNHDAMDLMCGNCSLVLKTLHWVEWGKNT